MLLAGLATVRADAQDDLVSPEALRSSYAARIRPLLATYCIDCHDQDTTSRVRLDTLRPDIAPDTIAAWTHVKDRLDVGSMPPTGKPRPTASESELLLAWIGGSLARYDADHRENGGDTLIRRINNRAYANIIRTLLDVPGPAPEVFPVDGQVRGFDTVGAGLDLTASSYDLYWSTAQQALDLALPESATPPAVKEFRLDFCEPGKQYDFHRHNLEIILASFRKDPKHVDIANGCAKVLGPLVVPAALRKMVDPGVVGTAIAAFYGEATMSAVDQKKLAWRDDPACIASIIAAIEAQIRQLTALESHLSPMQPTSVPGPTHRYDLWADTQPGFYTLSAKLCLLNAQMPLPVGFYAQDRLIRSFLLDDPQAAPRTYEATVFCRGGRIDFSIHAALPTGIFGSSFNSYHFFMNHVMAMYGITMTQADLIMRLGANPYLLPPPGGSGDGGTQEFAPPHILTDGWVVRGPNYASWPPPAVARIFTRGLSSQPTRDYAQEIVESFLKRAYVMGDCSAEQAEPFVELIMAHYGTGKDFPKAVKFGLAAVLCSPRFLYLDEQRRGDSSSRRPLTGFELARRLAYFLWSDLPDEALLASAASGALLDAGELAAQTTRLLQDRRSRAFREAFTTQWLKIDRLDKIAFSYEQLPAFNIVLLDSAREESVAFFSEILDHDLSALNFIDSDFTMLDACLAHHYGIPGITGNEMRRVQLAPGSHRGGVPTQASVLMATSNGMTASLVRRGAFLMDRLLGVSPGRPPPNVPALDQTRTANDDGSPFAPRERLALHRENASCARCHDHIDPLGVGLENFNALGSWSTMLRLPLAVPDRKTGARWVERVADARGAMLDGTPFDGPDELKQQLSKKPDRFMRCLAENLLVYALGREVERSDRSALERICAAAATHHHSLRSLVVGIVLSELFRDK